MNNIPTAVDFWQANQLKFGGSIEIAMKKFTELHVKAALKAASKVELDDVELMPEANDFEESRELSILNSYPLNLIK